MYVTQFQKYGTKNNVYTEREQTGQIINNKWIWVKVIGQSFSIRLANFSVSFKLQIFCEFQTIS